MYEYYSIFAASYFNNSSLFTFCEFISIERKLSIKFFLIDVSVDSESISYRSDYANISFTVFFVINIIMHMYN